MRFDDRTADPKTHPHAFWFGGVKCFKEACHILRMKANPEVAPPADNPGRPASSCKPDLIRNTRFRSVTEVIASIAFTTRLRSTCCNCTRSAMTGGRSEFSSVNASTRCRRNSPPASASTSSMASLALTRDLVGGALLIRLRMWFNTSPARLPSRIMRSTASLGFAKIRWFVRQPVQAGIAAGNDRSERLVYFVGNGRSKFPHRRHAGDARQFRQRLMERLFRLFPFSDIHGRTDELDELVKFVEDRMSHTVEMPR